jgi:hypothetical protein
MPARKIGVIPNVGPRGITVRTKVTQLPTNTTHPVSFGQAVVEAAKATTTTSTTPFGQAAAAAIKGATATASPTGGGFGSQAIQKFKEATAAEAARLAHGPDKLKLPAGSLDKPPLATGPTPGGGPGHGVDKLKLPAGTLGDKAEIPATKGSGTSSNPPTAPTMPHGPRGGGYGGGGFGGGDVVTAPAIPAAVGAAAPVAGQQVVQQTPACGSTRIPRLAEALDQLLPTAQLAAADLETVRALRVAIADLAAAGKYLPARVAEEQAMGMLGYSKLWFRCGDGGFTWTKQVADIR